MCSRSACILHCLWDTVELLAAAKGRVEIDSWIYRVHQPGTIQKEQQTTQS